MHDKLCFVQFMHPGNEHRPDQGDVRTWNTGAHLRKFMKRTGRYVTPAGLTEDDIVFWGEWEAESRVIQRFHNGERGLPKFLAEPYYVARASYTGFQNTDPFVFGDQFHFTICQQATIKGPTQLRYLSNGSVVLFGSHLDGHFFLDTVLVVARNIDHTRRDFEQTVAPHVSEVYRDITLLPIHQEKHQTRAPAEQLLDPKFSLRLYFGATFERPYAGIYSFFPCLPFSQGSGGFARPKIALNGVITDILTQGKRLNEQTSVERVRVLWQEVARQVEMQGLRLGVYAELPPRLASSAEKGGAMDTAPLIG